MRRLVGGTNAAESEFPYQASLRYFDLHICSGTLISDKHVLSAAHCVCGLIDYPSEELSVRTGSIKLTEGEKHAVKSIACHPDYLYGPEESWTADIVVITVRFFLTYRYNSRHKLTYVFYKLIDFVTLYNVFSLLNKFACQCLNYQLLWQFVRLQMENMLLLADGVGFVRLVFCHEICKSSRCRLSTIRCVKIITRTLPFSTLRSVHSREKASVLAR